jgi:ATP-dependent helicase/nuclease subunit A
MAVDFENGSVRDLAQFLEHLNALEKRGITGSNASVSGCVTIISIHKSKGLEYPVVFLSNLSKRFNQESLRAQILCDKRLGIGVSIADSQNRVRYPSVAKRAIAVKMAAESLSEEMRVLYVALTRARDRQIMTYASDHLEKVLKDLAYRRDFDGGELLCRDSKCLGNWVLISAISKIEAGNLHAIADRPTQTSLSEHPWKIEVVSAPQENEIAADEILPNTSQVPAEVMQMLQTHLHYQYPHAAATLTPSKQTATGRKGRSKDEEAAQNTRAESTSFRTWRKASFVDSNAGAIAYGNAMHSAMQHIAYDKCCNTASVREEISRLTQKGLLTQEQAKLINPVQIANFFQTKPGTLLRSGISHVREFKFSILDDGKQYGSDLEGEQVLLQGVVDCAILEEDGITILDFKTDRVTDETLEDVVRRYRPQVEAYAQAMERIYDLPVKRSCLYFFRLNRFVQL